MTAILSVLAVALGAILLAEIALLIGWYWSDGERRSHVLGMAVSYFILVVLATSPVTPIRLSPRNQSIAAIVAEVIGIVALWLLVYRHSNGDKAS